MWLHGSHAHGWPCSDPLAKERRVKIEGRGEIFGLVTFAELCCALRMHPSNPSLRRKWFEGNP